VLCTPNFEFLVFFAVVKFTIQHIPYAVLRCSPTGYASNWPPRITWGDCSMRSRETQDGVVVIIGVNCC
jgi:hypothetical protein